MKLVWRSPLFFKHGGLYLRVWGRWYRVFRIGEN